MVLAFQDACTVTLDARAPCGVPHPGRIARAACVVAGGRFIGGGHMDLAFGTHVREHFYDIGRLTGLDADQNTHAVRSIVVSPEAIGGVSSVRRPFGAVLADHFDGDIELRAFPDDHAPSRGERVVTLTSDTRLTRDGHDIGHLVAVEINPDSGEITGIVARHHWWMPRLHFKASGLDFSHPGEIHVH